MTKPAKSQWDFGELFPVEATRKVLTVAELTAQVKRLLEKQVGQVWVTGEITNLRAQASGHVYFTLKDAATQLSCVLFRGEAVAARAALLDGQKVVLRGEVTVYEARGQYQLLVREIELQGVGALQLAFERLKQKLAAEGLFAPERKRPIPRYPARLGLVTSPTGAAIRDVLHVIQRRHPGLEIILAPCRVQGDGAAGEIAAAIRLLNEFSSGSSRREEAQFNPETGMRSAESSQSLLTSAATGIDLILITRGGGSLEDLWAFNEEVVARAIATSAVPVMSAVGHEIDFTIADFVADQRAATPSAAAELITEGAFASRQIVADTLERLVQLARQRLATVRTDCGQAIHRLALAHPRRRLAEAWQRLDDFQAGLGRAMTLRLDDRQAHWLSLQQRLRLLRPAPLLARRRQTLRESERRLRASMSLRLQLARDRVAATVGRLQLLSPANVLARGYSITTDAETGRVIRAAATVRTGQTLRTQVATGTVRSVVTEG